MPEWNTLSQPRDAVDVAIWARLNGFLVLPGVAKSKKPMSFLWGDKSIDGDSYHVPSPVRQQSIRDFWRNTARGKNEDLLSITFDTEYADLTNPEVFIAALDLDTDKFYDQFINHPLLQRFPAVRGKKGAKVFLKVDYGGEDRPKNGVYQDPAANNENSLEVLTRLKLAFLYGEHPDSTRDNPIYYRYVRGFGLQYVRNAGEIEDDYHIDDADKIPTVSYEEFKQIVSTVGEDLGLVKKEGKTSFFSNITPMQHLRRKVRREGRTDARTLSDKLGLRVEDICMPDNGHRMGDEIIGAHPFHGSSGGQNFRINPTKNVWQCYRAGHDSGGDPLMAYAMSKGIVQCEECHPGLFDNTRLFREVIEALKRDGYDLGDDDNGCCGEDGEYHAPGPVEMPSAITNIPVITDRNDLPSLEEFANAPMYTHLSASPRKGKTHRINEFAVKGCPSATYITHTHATCGQAFRIAKNFSEELRENGVYRTVIWMAGKAKCCIHDKFNGTRTPCRECPLYPGDERIPMNRYEWMAEHMINSKICLSPEIVKETTDRYCPYYILREAEQYADVCITVPHFVTVNDKDRQIQPRETIIIDEDTTMANFYPGSIELASFFVTASQYHFDHTMDKIKERVDSLKKVAVTGDDGEPKKRLRIEDRIIMAVSDKIDEMQTIMHNLLDNPGVLNPLEAFSNFDLTISFKNNKGVSREITREEKISTIHRIEKYEHEIGGKIDEDNSILQLFESFLFHYRPNPLAWQGASQKKLYLIGDEEDLIRPIGLSPVTQHMIIIGFTRAEKFIENMQVLKPGDSVKYDIKKFDYGKNFILVKVGSNHEDGVVLQDGTLRLDARKSAKKRFNNIINHAAQVNKSDLNTAIPSIVLTSSEMRQDKIIKKHNSNFYPLKKEGIAHIDRMKLIGSFLVVVSNSTFTRGIDVDMYDTLSVESTDYAQPYCDAMFAHALRQEDVTLLDKASLLRYSYIVDEITNCVLRVSPIRGRDEDQTKIVVIPDYDAEKIHPKVLEDMHVVEFNDDSKMDSLWNLITLCARKYTIVEDMVTVIPGLNYHDAKEEFERFVADGPEESRLVAAARRERNSKIDRTITTMLKNRTRLSRAHILKTVPKLTRIPGLKGSEIEARLRYLSTISTLSSMMDTSKNMMFYRLINNDSARVCNENES